MPLCMLILMSKVLAEFFVEVSIHVNVAVSPELVDSVVVQEWCEGSISNSLEILIVLSVVHSQSVDEMLISCERSIEFEPS